MSPATPDIDPTTDPTTDPKRDRASHVTHRGGCHCGRVRFEADAPAHIDAIACNCSLCAKTGYLHLIVDRDRFRLLSGSDDLTTYRFNTGTAQHYFCATCGIKSFYVPRSHPDGYSLNVRCLDPDTIASISTRPFDGQNWEASIDALRGGDASQPEP